RAGGPTVRVTILSSGSSGNALALQSEASSIYIDAGLRGRTLRRRLPGAAGRVEPSAAFITHEHADHVCGAEELAAQGLLLYATAGTARAATLSAEARLLVRQVEPGACVQHGRFSVRPVAL